MSRPWEWSDGLNSSPDEHSCFMDVCDYTHESLERTLLMGSAHVSEGAFQDPFLQFLQYNYCSGGSVSFCARVCMCVYDSTFIIHIFMLVQMPFIWCKFGGGRLVGHKGT